jgi:CheY-like chemotaxis protein
MNTREVLVVDDDRIALMLHSRILIKTSYCDSTKEFLNGALAHEYIRTHDEAEKTFILFLDINMPIMSGFDLLDHLVKKPPLAKIGVYMVTSSIDPDDKLKAAEYGIVKGYLGKPLYDAVIENLD